MPARNVTVSPDDTQQDSQGPGAVTKATPGSPLFNLAARRQARLAQLFLDVPVPRWNDGPDGVDLHVRYGPVSAARMEHLGKSAAKSKDPDKNVRLNAALLAEACQGVFVLTHGPEGEELRVSADPASTSATDPDQWPRFDDALAESLGLPLGLPATDVVRALYFTDGDVISTADRLGRWSGYALGQQDADALGE